MGFFGSGFSVDATIERAKKLALEADNEGRTARDTDSLLRSQTKAATAAALAAVATAVLQKEAGGH
jgi:hypothetical protein